MSTRKIITEREIVTYLQTVSAASASDMACDFATDRGWNGTAMGQSLADSLDPYVNVTALRKYLEQLVKEDKVVVGSPKEAYDLFGSHRSRGNTKYVYWLPQNEAERRVLLADLAQKERERELRAEAERLVLKAHQDEIEAVYQELLDKQDT